MLEMTVASILGITLLIAGGSKMPNLAAHSRVVMGYKIIPDRAAAQLGKVLPFIEIALGLLVLVPSLSKGAGIAAAVLFLVYATGLTINLVRGRTELDCGCFAFGNDEEAPHITWWHALRAVGFAAMGLSIVLLRPAGSVSELIVGLAIGAVIVAVVLTGSALVNITTPGRTRVDDYLGPMARELHRGLSTAR